MITDFRPQALPRPAADALWSRAQFGRDAAFCSRPSAPPASGQIGPSIDGHFATRRGRLREHDLRPHRHMGAGHWLGGTRVSGHILGTSGGADRQFLVGSCARPVSVAVGASLAGDRRTVERQTGGYRRATSITSPNQKPRTELTALRQRGLFVGCCGGGAADGDGDVSVH
jgi:hypothetical protein